jgi:O-antigen/teichoic acid export membrane protein
MVVPTSARPSRDTRPRSIHSGETFWTRRQPCTAAYLSAERSRISVNAGYQLIAQAAVLGLNLFTSPIIVHGLGLEAYGLLVLIGVTTNYFGIVELGLGRATVQILARHRARGEHEDFSRVLWTATGAYFVVSLIGAGALVAVSPLLVRRVLAVSEPLVPQALHAFVIGAVGLVIAMQRNVASAAATALERFDVVSRVTVVLGALQALLNVALVLLGASLTGVMLGGLAVQTMGFFVYFATSWHLVPNLFPPRWGRDDLRTIVRTTGFISVSQVISPILEQVEKVLIGAFAAVSQVPFYSVSYSVAWALTVVPTSLVLVIYPALARLLSQHDHAGVRETANRAARYTFVFLVGPVVMLLVHSPSFLAAWMGPEFAVGATPCLRILSLAVLVNVLGWPSLQLLQAAGRANVSARYHLIELAIHIPVSVVLISRGGVVGAAVAWLLRVTLDTTLMLRAAARITETPMRAVLGSLGRGTLAALALLPLALAVRPFLAHSGRLETFLLLGLAGLCYVPAVIWFGLGRDDRSALLLTFRGLIKGPS